MGDKYSCPFCGGFHNGHTPDCYVSHVFESGLHFGRGSFSKASLPELIANMQRTWTIRVPPPAIPIIEAQEPKKAKFVPYSADGSSGACSECYGYLYKNFKFCPSCGLEIEGDERKD